MSLTTPTGFTAPQALPTAKKHAQIEKHKFTILPLGLTLIVFEGSESKLLWEYGGKVYLEDDVSELLRSDLVTPKSLVRHVVEHVRSSELDRCTKEALKNHDTIARL